MTAVVLVACSCSGIRVRSEPAPDVDFAAHSTRDGQDGAAHVGPSAPPASDEERGWRVHEPVSAIVAASPFAVD